MTPSAGTRPWYREPWPWLLMAGPALVVVASMVTLWLAITSDDGLVADDYYKRGLAINQELTRDRNAAAHGYRAVLGWDAATGRLRVTLEGKGPLPPTLQLRLLHPTRAGFDRQIPLAALAPGVYEATVAAPGAGRWLVTMEDESRSWRLTGEWRIPQQTMLQLVAH
ncbi:MAG: FixH family protein [Burkholderiales bacterium]